MKNKKGFTLVELMAVIVILAIIISVAVPSALAISQRIKNKMYDTKIDMILNAAKIYGQDHPQKVFSNENCPSDKTIKVEELVNNGYIKKDKEVEEGNNKKGIVENPKDNSSMNDMKICIYKRNNRVYSRTVN